MAVAFSPDSKTFATASSDGTARLWDGTTAKPLGPPLPHPSAVRAVAFSPDGRTVLTGSVDGRARLWATPAPVAGDVEQIVLWTQVLAGMELDPAGVACVLDAQTWHQRRQRLHERGGPPMS
jgi:WD40 repeat protein